MLDRYKRRAKGSELVQEDDLFGSADTSVLGRWVDTRNRAAPSRRFGFWVPLVDVAARRSLRADPKYMWQWSVNSGEVSVFDTAGGEQTVPHAPLSELIKPHSGKVIKRGILEPPRTYVEAGTLSTPKTSEMAMSVGQKKDFCGSDLAVHRISLNILRPAGQDWIGSRSWELFKILPSVDADYVHALMLSEGFRHAMACIQSGMQPRHFLSEELLALRVPLPTKEMQQQVGKRFRHNLATASRLQEEFLHQEKVFVDDALNSLMRGSQVVEEHCTMLAEPHMPALVTSQPQGRSDTPNAARCSVMAPSQPFLAT